MKETLEKPHVDDNLEESDNVFGLLSLLRTGLHRFFSKNASNELLPGGCYVDYEELELQGELSIVIPPNLQPARLVIVGDWEGNYPEVKLEQSGPQLIATLYAVSTRNMADGDWQHAFFQYHQE